MAISSEYKAYLEDQLSDFGSITIKRMFGGAGIWHQNVMFALIADDVLYLKVGAENISDFEKEGMKPFTYQGKSRPVQMSYYEVPAHILEDPHMLADWAGKAYAIAARPKST